MSTDPFPRDRIAAMVRRMPAYLRLSWRLAKEPLLSKARRAAVIGAAGYLASPVDLVPGVIPVIGQLDDIAVALAAIRIALAGLDPDRRQAHLDAVGLADADLGEDLRTVVATTAWIGRATFRTTRRVAITGSKVAIAGVGMAVRGTRAAGERGAPMAKDAAGAALDAGSKAAVAGGRVARSGAALLGAAGAAGLRRLPGIPALPARNRTPAGPETLAIELDVLTPGATTEPSPTPPESGETA